MPRDLVIPAVCVLAWACSTEQPDVPPPTLDTDPGSVPVRLLNRTEYDHTVRDLLGTTLQPARDFPADAELGGFDNQAEALSISLDRLALFEDAAARLAAEAVLPPVSDPFVAASIPLVDLELASPLEGAWEGEYWRMFSRTEVTTTLTLEHAGLYGIRMEVSADQVGLEAVAAGILVDGGATWFDTTSTGHDDRQVLLREVRLGAGEHVVGLSFRNPYVEAEGADRELRLHGITLDGPVDRLENPVRSRLYTCDPDGDQACVHEILTSFAGRAWRRPPDAQALGSVLAVADQVLADGHPADWAVEFGLRAILTSPRFLYRLELGDEGRALDGWELASRLSYFLWSSTPDDALLAAAEDGSLLGDEVLRSQVSRMLVDPRAAALVDELGAQWLGLDALAQASPDPWAYPDFDEALRDDMAAELRGLIERALLGGVDMRELLTSRVSEVSPRLAAHYGVTADAEGRVDWSGSPRRGVLGTAAVLTALSHPTRTSPTRRGAWVMSKLLCSPPDPPPPGVGGLVEDAGATTGERLAAHAADPACAGCHAGLDGVGGALESFGGTGELVQTDAVAPALPDGTTLSGPGAVTSWVASQPEATRCMLDTTLRWALGRPLGPEDDGDREGISEAWRAGGYTFEVLAAEIVTSEAFRARRSEP